ncbi:N-acylneuraminate cytidylyltransferase [Breznakibacter xylanolyticus]|uniref:N-acylneuraminate cytidylyltransferase n=1 Tax=Breznakibacter xylanolyticus TaxID=990 RepID=A0A2W7N2M3_9BACT|nr:acylneuraminate cytidylyltransferase [Breznakibacter xylanolyticus]PZX14281.1 N-acylneuraminate cytidylyltransferase [Breznakibacter xylanolyticus]
MAVIGFVPVRGGSQSIPLKNIRMFCGYPLVYWVVRALSDATSIDRVVVATDSDDIEKVINELSLPKTTVYRRLSSNATDVASTESVMLEYIEYAQLSLTDVFVLAQATSPFTTADSIDGALQLYEAGRYDSLLSCVRQKRFFWNDNGTPMNYDHCHRPRRQDFNGLWMENGAFYVNKVAGIMKERNRLSGIIGIYEMPSHTAVEIDDPDDWLVAELLFRQHNRSCCDKGRIKLFLSDVDGVLTDAGMYYTENGDELKKFNTRDGMGFSLLQQAGVKTGVITTENTAIVDRRAKKLRLNYVIQGKRDGGKLASALDICREEGISIHEVAYIGDDINCLDLLSQVGLAACPSDAVDQVKRIPGIHILSKKGGEGVVRELADYVLSECR